MTSIRGVPVSLLQALCLLSRGGSCDPWIEDFRQSYRYYRFEYEINELVDVYSCDIPKSISPDEFIKVTLPKDILAKLQEVDINNTGMVPVEAIRTYIDKGENNVVNSQISAFFWSICRADGEEPPEESSAIATVEEDGLPLEEQGSMQTFQTGGAVRPEVRTVFKGDPVEYMKRFETDVATYLESMPAIDTNVILGYLPLPLIASSAHELVGDAMKLDVSARNTIPTTSCIWMGQRMCRVSRILAAVVSQDNFAIGSGMQLGVGEASFHGKEQLRLQSPPPEAAQQVEWLANLRIHVEVDLISKYPEMCEVRASDRHYGPAGNDAIDKTGGVDGADDHWKELTERRLARADKLTLSWRDAMLNEWSASLYESR